jgi:hypothetical protein
MPLSPAPAGERLGEGAWLGEEDRMRTLEGLSKLERAEEFLDFFGIAYDPELLASRRVRLLKRYGMSVAMIDRITAPLTEQERLRLHREALEGQWERLVLETTCASSYYAKKAGGCAACGTHAPQGGHAEQAA